MKTPALCSLLGVVVALAFLQSTASGATCSTYATGTLCIVDTACGWCQWLGGHQCMTAGTSGTPLSPPRPRFSPAACTSMAQSVWFHNHSQIYGTLPGYPVSPNLTLAYVKPGDAALPIPITVYVPNSDDQSLDFFFLHDVTGSMQPNVNMIGTLAPKLIASVLALRRDTWFGLSSFRDKPCSVCGQSNDWVFSLSYPIQANYSGLQAAVAKITATGGSDTPEADLDAMIYASCPVNGWRKSSLKLLFVATDAKYHFYRDGYSTWYGTCSSSVTASTLASCSDMPSTSSGTVQVDTLSCQRKLPTALEARAALVAANVFPVIGVIMDDTGAVAEPLFETLTQSIFGFGQTTRLTTDSSNIVSAVEEAIAFLTSTITMILYSDPYGYATNPTPGTINNVVPKQTYNFSTTLFSSTTVTPEYVELRAIGWGSAFIYVNNILPVVGCDGIIDSNTVYDLCNVCNGTNACLDCLGVPFGPNKKDVCNVCNGNGTTCLDCFNQPFGTAKLDVCNVCGGDGSSCQGCDHKSTIPMKTYDLCGVCGGNNSCIDCTNKPYGSLKLDQCGICGGNDSCIGCDGVARSPPYQYDQCGICGGNGTTCTDCHNIPWGKAEFDRCGVCGGNNSCVGCDGVARMPPATVDACGECGGKGVKCMGCDGVPNSGKVLDRCGVCGGNNQCVGCNNKTATGSEVVWYYDLCGVCTNIVNLTCVGCDGVAFSGKQYDECFVCGGNNTCRGCDGVAFSGKQYDECGLCGGNGMSCYGCDGVKWSGKILDDCGICGGTDACLGCDRKGGVYDACGICNGDNKCVGCDGVPFSNASFDDCNICRGKNTCWGCDYIAFSGKVYDNCGICGGSDECVGCDNKAWSNKSWDACGVCDGKNDTCWGCDHIPNSGAIYDDCGVCNGGNTCPFCDGIPWVEPDECGVCGGNNSCWGCDRKPGGLAYDLCGVCGGNSDCVGCDGKPFGANWTDRCGVCGGNNSCVGCDGELDGATYDNCGVCRGNNSCYGCDNVRWSHKVLDNCSVCGGNNSCIGCDHLPSFKEYDSCGVCGGSDECVGCDGVRWSGKTIDKCGKCGGNSTNCCDYYDLCGICYGQNDCLGCDGLPWGTTTNICGDCSPNITCPIGCDGQPYGPSYDQCGACNGKGDCLDCLGVAWGTAKVDLCGVCGGANDCVGCDNVVYATSMDKKTYDICGICGGNMTCLGCDNVPWSGIKRDACGTCGGNVTKSSKCSNTGKIVTAGVTAAGAVIGATLVGIAGAIAGFFLYKRWANGANWYIPNALRGDGEDVVQESGMYEGDDNAGFHNNPLADEK
eukprot:m51a1_g1415 putative lectin domain-containing protein (1303) ;mRNA; r:35350-40195